MLTSWVDLAVGELNTGRVTARQDDLPNQGVATNPAESGGPVRARIRRADACDCRSGPGLSWEQRRRVGARGVLPRPRVVRAGLGRASDNIAPAERDLNWRLRARGTRPERAPPSPTPRNTHEKHRDASCTARSQQGSRAIGMASASQHRGGGDESWDGSHPGSAATHRPSDPGAARSVSVG